MKITKTISLILLTTFLFAQGETILPGQKLAIQSLSTAAGFSNADLNTYIIQNYGQTLDALSRTDGAAVIKAFQAGSASKPVAAPIKPELQAASILEPGMKKLFHFRDGTVREGEILTIEDGIAVLKTGSGSFNIPADQFLSETAEITNKKGELFKGVHRRNYRRIYPAHQLWRCGCTKKGYPEYETLSWRCVGSKNGRTAEILPGRSTAH